MDIRKIKKLIELLEESGIAEIEIHEGEESVRISRHGHNTVAAALPASPALVAQPPTVIPDTAAAAVQNAAHHTLKAPMVGTFYRSASPGGRPLVEIGQSVEVGDPVCIIEAMKMFNQIESERAGVVREVLVDNGQPVEFDQPLLVIE